MPLAAPVTTATFPCTSFMVTSSMRSGGAGEVAAVDR
jgi:hypothetical protein